MADLRPFAALRPRPDLAPKICELPYDVLSSEEARELARDNPLSFFHVSKPEIDLPPGTNPYAPEVYETGRKNLGRLIAEGALVQEKAPAFFLYRQTMGSHSQTGLVAIASCEEYLKGGIKKHELTRPDKEEDRVRHIEVLNAQTGPAFLTYRSVKTLDTLLQQAAQRSPDVTFTARDGVGHAAWTISDSGMIDAIQSEFAHIGDLYIADGHHRSAAAARVSQARAGRGESSWFLSVVFPHDQMQILPYNRVLRDLNGRTQPELMHELDAVFIIQASGKPRPTRAHELGFHIGGKWFTLSFRPKFAATSDPIEKLDVTLLQNYVLDPIFGIQNPRTSDRINFVGGIRGTAELEKLVQEGNYACAFSMFPTRIEDLMGIADAGGIMPPKSTWFEPKLRDAMFCHLL